MKILLIGCLVAWTGSALADMAPRADKSGAAALARGWVRNEFGVWSRVEGPYRDSYMRRGCRIDEDWDGAQYAATVNCPPGVKPN